MLSQKRKLKKSMNKFTRSYARIHNLTLKYTVTHYTVRMCICVCMVFV